MPEDKEPQTIRLADDDRSGLSIWSLKRSFLENLFYTQGTFQSIASPTDLYMALAYTVRDRLLTRWTHTVYSYLEETGRLVGYLSMEFLPGPHLLNNMVNLGIHSQMQQAMSEMGYAGCLRAGCGEYPMTRRSPGTAPTPWESFGCGRPSPSSPLISPHSIKAITWAPCRRRSFPRRSPRCFIPTMPPQQGSSS